MDTWEENSRNFSEIWIQVHLGRNFSEIWIQAQNEGLMQERCNFIANALSYVFLALTHRNILFQENPFQNVDGKMAAILFILQCITF